MSDQPAAVPVTAEDDFAPSTTEGYKAPPKKTVEELQQLDANDESLRKWKEQLLKGTGGAADPNDKRRVIVLQLAMESEGRQDILLDLSSPESLAQVEKSSFVIKEGVDYRLKVKFRVQNEVVAGLKYLQVTKRHGIRVDKMEEMIGSYGPAAEPYEKKFPVDTAPSGMLVRGQYNVVSRFVDDDGNCHLQWAWNFQIKKEWD